MRRHLVIARVGRKSLHPSWIDPGTDRDWDLYLCPFQEIPAQTDIDCTTGEVFVGPKWTGLDRLLKSWNGWRDYEYVWLPDDDIFASQADIDAMFQLGKALEFDLFAPALQESSYYAHYITMANRSFFARRVGFVEIMMPCFRTTTLEELLPTLELSTTGWGWGLDSVWPKLMGYKGLGILDCVSVLHTRPVGAFRDPELRRRVLEESDTLLRNHACGQQMITFAGVDANLLDVKLNADQLLVRLVEGWQYLLRRDPSVLRWVVEHQRGSLDTWPEYPVEGCPSGPAKPSAKTATANVMSSMSWDQKTVRRAAEPTASAHGP
jgi:hypothetical protein